MPHLVGAPPLHLNRLIAQMCALVLLFGLVIIPGAPALAADPVPGGPVILDGNDPGDHVAQTTAYVQSVYASLDSNVAVGYVHNNSVAVIGTCTDRYLNGMGTGQTFVGFETVTAVEGLFASIGTNNYKHIHICSADDNPSTLDIDLQTELDKWGSAIAAHVNRGGGLFATGHSFNWLGDLFPGIVATFGGTSSSYVTTDGAVFFPSLAVNQQVNAINHYTFSNIAGSPLLALLTESPDGAGQLVAIGGSTVRFPQISFQGPTTGEVGTVATYTLTAATADGVPLSSNAFSWTITGVTDAVSSGTATTDANGQYTFTFTGNNIGETRISVLMDLSGQSAGSAITTIWATVPAIPVITSAVDVPGEDDSVVLSWNAPTDGGRAIIDYAIEYSVNGTDWTPYSDGVSTATGATVTGLETATQYQFRVAAINDIGQGGWSTPAPATPFGSPTAPVLTTAIAGDGQVDLEWDAPSSDNGSAVTHYIVEWQSVLTPGWIVSGPNPTTTEATVTGLTNGETYEFRVAAVNSNGQGSWSNILEGAPITIPGAVVLRVIESDGTLVFEWPEPDFDGNSEVTGYEVTTTFASDCLPTHFHPTGDDRHWYRCTVTGLTNGEAQTFGVAATNAAGTGPVSEITGTPFGAPLAPDVTLVSEGNRTVKIIWTAADGNGRDVTAYEIVVSDVVIATVGAGVRAYNLTNLINGTEYTIDVRAVNAAGPGASGSVQAIPYTTPDAPPLTVTFANGLLTVVWDAPFDGGRDITGYILVIEGVDLSLEVAYGSGARSHLIEGLAPGTYTVTIAASNEAGQGPWGSAEATESVTDDEPDPIVPDGSPFDDTVGSVFEDDIAWLAARGITKGCNPPENDMFCPDAIVIRAEVATFLDRYFELPATDVDGFTDDDGHELEASLDSTKVAGVFRGCNPPTNSIVCPDRVITRGELAAVVVRAFNLHGTGGSDFVDSANHVFHAEIAVLSATGIARGCNPPANDRFCPDRELTRGEVAAFLHRVSLLEG